MKRFAGCILTAALLCLILGLSGCKSSQASNGAPKVLRYAFAPQNEQLQNGQIRSKELSSYLEKQLNMPVEVVLVEGYAPTIEAMRSEKVDVAGFGPLSYLIAAQKANAEAIVTRGFPDGKIGGYRAVIAVPKNSPYHSIQDIKDHAKDIVFVFADPASTSGYLYPRVELQNLGMNPDSDFKKVVFAGTGTHATAALTIKTGKVDAGAFSLSIYDKLVHDGKIQPDDIRILWQSELIPTSPTAVRKGLPEQLKKQIQTALIALPTKDPDLWKSLDSMFPMREGGPINIPITDAAYDGLRHYVTQVKGFDSVEK